MSDYDRGRYSPATEPPLAFDARRTARTSGPAPVTLILSLMLLVGVGGGVFYIYRGGVRGPGDAPRPVGAPVGDVRIAAPPQVQTPDPAAGLSIYKDDPNAAPVSPAFVPPPEQPTPRPGTVTATVAPVASPTPTAAAATPVKVATVTPAKATKAASPPDVKAPTAEAAASPPVKPATAKASAPAKAASIDTVLATASPLPAKSGPAMVQIGAFSSKDLADAGWNDAAGFAPGDMVGKGKRVVPLTKADGSTLYRTSITGFASRDEAVALCAKLKAAGRACLVK